MRDLRWNAAVWMGIGLALAITGCGGSASTGGGTGGGTTTYTLTVNSTNPASGVAITVSPADNNSASSGTTSFSRTYNSGTSVTLTAPATSGGNNFSAWSGCASTSGETCTVAMNANATVTAAYTAAVATTYTLTVNSTNPASGVAITDSPADNSSKASGTTGFTLTYNAGTSVTLTAPATSGSNTFSAWTGCTSTSGETCTVAMNANATVTVAYSTPATTTYTLTVDSTNPASGVAITDSPADNSSKASGTTGFTLTYNSGASVTLTAPATSGSNTFSSWSGCASSSTETCNVTLSANTTVTANYTTPVVTTYTLTVDSTNPASGVAISVNATDVNGLANGSTSFTRTYDKGASVTLTAPATASGNAFSAWSGCSGASSETCSVSMNANTTVTAGYAISGLTTPTVTVTPGASSILATQPLTVTVAVSGSGTTPTGSVILSSGSYTSAATALVSGSASINVPANSLAAGSDTLSAAYTPDTTSSTVYKSATGTSTAVAVTPVSTVSVDQSSLGPNTTDQILGMNLAAWYDIKTNDTAIVDAFAPQTVTGTTVAGGAGIQAVRWPGGSASDDYHWATNSECNSGYTVANDTFSNFVSDIVQPAGLDLALTADYGTDAACTGPGDPSEAAAWAAAALTDGVTVSHMTVGNEEYGSWETDMHTAQHDPTTYAAAVGTSTSNGYYEQIRTASSGTLVGVDVNPGNSPAWDPTVLANSSYDFVEYHYYVFNPGNENDTTLVHSAAQTLTTNIKTIKSELNTAGNPNTPIYVGEIGSVSSNPGKQSWSITQGLYAGQALGEMMNDGVARATWWIGFGNCNGAAGNDSSSLYGWQSFGAYNVFSDGPTEDPTCPDAGPLGTMSPTARAFQLFSQVAVNGESVLTPTVSGDTTDVRAYAATHSGGTALVLFNDNETTNEGVTITLSAQTNSTDVTVETYDKAIYDETDLATPVWAAPAYTDMGAQSLPLTLTLAPWSMNVVMIH